jgi:hypothetical protein
MAATNPIDHAQDYVVIAGHRTPGLCEIIGASSPRNWEELGGSGWSGGILLYRGIKLSHFSIRLYLYESKEGGDQHDDWGDWFRFRPIVMKRPTIGQPNALDCVHPFLNDLGITALVIEDVRAPDQVDHGVWMIELMCIEYRKLRKDSTAMSGSDATDEDPLAAEARRAKEEDDKLADEGNELMSKIDALP